MSKKKSPVTRDIVITGKQIESLVNKVINDGFKRNHKLNQKYINTFYRQTHNDLKTRIKKVVDQKFNESIIKRMILDELLERYSWDELVELGIKE